jgi:hypothetical protein
MGRQPIAK